MSMEDSRKSFQSEKQRVEELWEQFSDIPMDPETETMEEPFLHFPAGTSREDIWHWFDVNHPGGIAYLLYKDDTLMKKAETR